MAATLLFLPPGPNALAGATLTAPVRPSQAYRLAERRARGTGRLVLGGASTAPVDTAFEVEVTSTDTGATATLSAPVYTGVGDCTLTDVAVAPGTPSQTYTLTLADLDTDTTTATLALEGYTLRARRAGAAGNAVTIAVDESTLTVSAPRASTVEALSAGTTSSTGAQWDYGAQPLSPGAELAADTPRLQFGRDPQIYRQYRQTVDGVTSYVWEPAIVRDLPAGTAVRVVSGTRAVTVSDGSSSEPFAAATLYDFLAALAHSQLVEVAEWVSPARRPGLPAVRDLDLRTTAYALPATGTGSADCIEAAPAVDLTVPAGAATELLTLRCTEATVCGGEQWRLVGSGSGDLGLVTSGTPTTAAGYTLTIPRRLPPSTAPTGELFLAGINYQSRAAGETAPPICLDLPTLGAQAPGDTTLTLTYRIRPPTTGDCACETTPYTGRLSAACLGLETQEGTMAWATEYQSRIETVVGWFSAFAGTNASISGGQIHAAKSDLDAAQQVRDVVLIPCLDDLFVGGVPPTGALTAFDALAAQVAADFTSLSGIDTFALPAATDLTGVVVAQSATYNITAETTYRLGDRFFKALEPKTLTASGGTAGTTFYFANGVGSPNVGDVYYVGLNAADSTSAPAAAVYLGTVESLGFTGDLSVPTDATAGRISAQIVYLVQKYQARADVARVAAGMPPKKDSAGLSGGECWQDTGAAGWWEFQGGDYLPAFSNVVYVSAKRVYDPTTKQWSITSARAFGFVLKVQCEGDLRDGDQVTLQIRGGGSVRTYAEGDEFRIPVIAGAPARLAGGVDGNDTYTWSVQGSVSGALTPYAVVRGAEQPYAAGGLSLRLALGATPGSVGDRWQFEVTGGRWRWRPVGGAWSAEADIGTGPLTLQDGLTCQFVPGPAPAWQAGDYWRIECEQPAAPQHLVWPDDEVWAWPDAAGELRVSWSAPPRIEVLAVSLHRLPAGASLTVDGSADGGLSWPLSATLPIERRTAVVVLPAAWTPTDLRVRLTGAAGGELGYLWAGAPLRPDRDPQACELGPEWAMVRGSGPRRRATYLGRGDGGKLTWKLASRREVTAMVGMVDALRRAGDWPLIVLPNAYRPEEARLVWVDGDRLSIVDEFAFRPLSPDDPAWRPSYTLELPLSGVPL